MEHVAIVARREDRLMSAARPWQCYIRSWCLSDIPASVCTLDVWP